MRGVFQFLNPNCPLCDRRCGMAPLICVACAYSIAVGATAGIVNKIEFDSEVQRMHSVDKPVKTVSQSID